MIQQELFNIAENKIAPQVGRQTIKKNINASKSQPRKNKKRNYIARVQVFYFQPFANRALLFPGSTVVGLDLGYYDYYLIKFIKGILAHYKGQAIDNSRLITSAGGWLPGCKCWYIEPNVWPEVKQVLIAANIEIRGV